jgi:hypothetical protein
MTNIYAYCLFDRNDNFHGVYSSLKAIHRDALKLCNKGNSDVVLKTDSGLVKPSLSMLRKIFKGEINTKVHYISDGAEIKILKTPLRE